MAENRIIWKIRVSKSYPDAKNHIIIGEVIEYNDIFIKLKGRTYHYGKSVNRVNDIVAGDIDTRIIPWHKVEIIHEIAAEFNYVSCQMAQIDDYTMVLTDTETTVPFINMSEKVF